MDDKDKTKAQLLDELAEMRQRIADLEGKRRQAAGGRRKADRALRTLSECNHVLVRATQEPELLR